jgi:hypothetical protein
LSEELFEQGSPGAQSSSSEHCRRSTDEDLGLSKYFKEEKYVAVTNDFDLSRFTLKFPIVMAIENIHL